MDQSGGYKVSGPDQFDNDIPNRTVDLIKSISNQNVSAQVKLDVMQRAVPAHPNVNMGCGRKRIPSLLDSGSQVILICQHYFESEILPHIGPSCGEKTDAHQLFQLTAGNKGRFPVSMYVKLDLDFLEVIVPNTGVLITQESNKLLD